MDRVLWLCGLIFGGIGAVFIAVGLLLAPVALGASPVFFVFPLLGLVFFILGVWMLAWRRRRRRHCAYLYENGQRVWAEFVELRLDERFAFNGRYPYVLLCEGMDLRDGTVHDFVSDGFWADPTPYLRPGLSVAVYVDPDNWDDYVVDVDSIFPHIEG